MTSAVYGKFVNSVVYGQFVTSAVYGQFVTSAVYGQFVISAVLRKFGIVRSERYSLKLGFNLFFLHNNIKNCFEQKILYKKCVLLLGTS